MQSEIPARRRRALVTGASYGIGAATAIGLAEDGFDVAVTDLRTGDLAATVGAIEKAGGPLRWRSICASRTASSGRSPRRRRRSAASTLD